MQKQAFSDYLAAQDLAEKTRQQRIYALARIEKVHEIDLDEEFASDGLAAMQARLTYSTADAAAGRPNPSKFSIDPDKLRTHLAWYKSHLASYVAFLGGVMQPLEVVMAGEESEEVAEAVTLTFGLEKDMQEALRKNLSQLEPGLTVIDGGNERKVDAGFIDILARDKDGTVVVIEIKAVASKPEAVAQVLGYMGAIAEEDNLEKVRGYLIAADHPKKVVWASKAVPNLRLKKYGFSFQFDNI